MVSDRRAARGGRCVAQWIFHIAGLRSGERLIDRRARAFARGSRSGRRQWRWRRRCGRFDDDSQEKPGPGRRDRPVDRQPPAQGDFASRNHAGHRMGVQGSCGAEIAHRFEQRGSRSEPYRCRRAEHRPPRMDDSRLAGAGRRLQHFHIRGRPGPECSIRRILHRGGGQSMDARQQSHRRPSRHSRRIANAIRGMQNRLRRGRGADRRQLGLHRPACLERKPRAVSFCRK
ncbi:MAG: hypothetical protein BWZ10_00560 [candidate division BRC1 bacterium ADurb.BinA364]|nr:MAG: hypothetical protein BWZ10_00560 [candidate division BRC1 bacterium ADurb.BinA364]